MKVRIAMQGYGGEGGLAETVDDVVAGVRCPWVELDGVRYDSIISAEFRAAKDSLSGCELVLDVIGQIELVYTDRAGEPLPGTPLPLADPTQLGSVSSDTYIARADLMIADD